MNKVLICTKDFCIRNRRNLIPVPATLMVAGMIGTYTIAPIPWQLPLILWIAAIVIPLILGMMEYIRFRWVLLWEIIMLFPIGLIVLILFGSAIIGLFKR